MPTAILPVRGWGLYLVVRLAGQRVEGRPEVAAKILQACSSCLETKTRRLLEEQLHAIRHKRSVASALLPVTWHRQNTAQAPTA